MSWVFGPGGTTATPGGADKDIQFNNNGEFSGSNLLTTDGSGSLSASVHVSASTYYGDGSNLTGLTASAVNVADGPEYSIQFRRDAPVTGEISGSANFRTNAARSSVFLTGTLIVSGAAAANIEGPVIITSPEGKLEVQDTTNNYQVTLVPSVIPRVAFGTISDEDQYMVIDGGATNRIITNNDFFIATSSTYNQGLYYDVSLERIGVNTSSPGATLHVSSSAENESLFRVDADPEVEPLLFVTSSGRVGIGTSNPGIGGSTDTMLDVQGHITIGKSGTAYIFNNNDSDTHIKLGGSGVPGTDGMTFTVGNKTMLILDENGTDAVTLGSAASDVIHASGSLTASVGMRVSASAGIGEDIFVGSGNTRTIGVLVDGSDDFFVMGHDAGAVTLSASSGIELVGGSEGVGSFGSDINVYATQAGGDPIVSLSTAGDISGSGNISGSSVYVDDVSANGVVVGFTSGRLISHGNFTFASNVLSVPAITASVGIDVTSSANGSINIGQGISYTFGGNGRLDVFENEFRLNKTNLYQAMFPEQTSNFNIQDSQVFLVDTNGSVVTGSLPAVSSTDEVGLTFTIKDSGGNAGTNDIIIEPNGSQKIDGASAAKIAINYGAMTVVALSSSVNGFGWGIVSAT